VHHPIAHNQFADVFTGQGKRHKLNSKNSTNVVVQLNSTQTLFNGVAVDKISLEAVQTI
jgi:hypothetical protein